MKWISKSLMHFLNVYEGEGTPPVKEPPDPLTVKQFSQDDVNRMMAADRKKATDANKALADQLQKSQETAGLTQKERDELQTQIESLQKTYMTKDELQKQETEKLKKQEAEEKKKLAEDRDTWKGQYSTLFIKGEIVQAALQNKAFSTEQMVDYLSPRTKLEPEIGEDKKPTGQFIPMTTIHVPDDKGKIIPMQLSIADAVKKMKELPDRFGNFFQVEGSGGLGGNNRGGGGGKGKTDKGAPIDPKFSREEYMAWRKNNLPAQSGVIK